LSPRARWIAADAAILVALKALVGAYVLRSGFTHVSDDDYARTVIAEAFARAPRLDPSGTSWLPFPFWVTGAAMLLAGASLETSRVVSSVLGAASAAAPYVALRAIDVHRGTSLAAAAIALALPWNAWLGVATVPEGWFGAVAAAAIVAAARPDARAACAIALTAAALSRYEAWPACAVFAIAVAYSSSRLERPGLDARRSLAWAAVALAGPLAWMAWNAHAHGDPIHFVARVSAFRRAIGAAQLPLRDKLLGYPRALVVETPEVAFLGAVALVAFGAARAFRRRWWIALLAAAAIVAFLIVGDVGDGAPTHHPERALTIVWWIAVAMGLDAIVLGAAAIPKSRAGRWGLPAAAGVTALAWAATLPSRWAMVPGNSDWDRREPQIARGASMRARGVEHAQITPCSFEHFALLAEWGHPERALVQPRTNTPPTAECPHVEER
jgi:hypothetical protein